MVPKEVICTHCFDLFHPNKAVFEIEYEGRISYHRTGDPGVDYAEKEKTIHEFVEKITYTPKKGMEGMISEKRCCPSCKKPLYPGAGRRQQYFICVAGAPSAGKSVYLSQLIHTLTVDQESIGSVSHIGNPEQRAFFVNAYINPMMKENRCPESHSDSTMGCLNTPGVFMYKPVPSSSIAGRIDGEGIDIVFFEIPGDAFSNHENPDIGRLKKLLNCCSGLLLVIDASALPYNQPYVRMLFPYTAEACAKPLSITDDIADWKPVLSTLAKIPPAAFILNKFDLLQHEQYYPFKREALRQLRDEPADNHYDEDKHMYERVSCIQEWLTYIHCDTVFNAWKELFSANQVFLSSALGGQAAPHTDGSSHGSLPENRSSFGERAPFDWMLSTIVNQEA